MEWRVLFVCAMLTLTGCNALVGGDATDTETAVVTPAPVPDDEALAPGLRRGGVESPTRLADAHGEALTNRSFTLAATRTVRYGDGTLRSRLSLVVAAEADRTYLVTAATEGPGAPVFLGRPPANASFWSNGTTFVRKLTRENRTTYNEFDAPTGGAATWAYWTKTVPFGGEQATPRSFYADVFEAVPVRVVGEESVDERTAYRLVGTRLEGRWPERDVEDVDDLRLVAVVSDEGLVRSLSVTYTATVDGEPVEVNRSIRYRAVGATTAPRPPWFERAVAGQSSAAEEP